MRNLIKSCGSFFILFFFIIGFLYPLLIFGFAQVFFPFQANGSAVYKQGIVIGSRLIGQNFTSPQYFHGRVSSEGISGGSNLGPTSKIWLEEVSKRIYNLKETEHIYDNELVIPSDLVTHSASGYDPHISMESALLQVPRIAKNRDINEDDVIMILNQVKETNSIFFFGEEIVNVLELNIQLDDYREKEKK